jgi:hypothetical protein
MTPIFSPFEGHKSTRVNTGRELIQNGAVTTGGKITALILAEFYAWLAVQLELYFV